jgi:hypothetical protein
MSTGALIAIVVVIVVVAAVVAMAAMQMRRRRLRRQFGPEYDRLATELGSRRKAETELAARERRLAQLDIRPLTGEESARYLGEWTAIQERFVDTPGQAVREASALVTSVLKVRGYPVDDEARAMEALSVDHAPILSRYREARMTSERTSAGSASTDDLRNAMLQYRAMFEELVGRPEDDGEPGAGRVDRQTAAGAPSPTAAGAPADDLTPAAMTPADAGETDPSAAERAAAGRAGGLVDETAPDAAVTGDAASPQRSTRG